MQPYERAFPCLGLDGQHVEPPVRAGKPALSEKLPGHARQKAPLIRSDRVFGQCGRVRLAGPGLHFYERQYGSIEANEVDFTLKARRPEVAADDDVAMAPQIPVGKRLASYADQMPGLLRAGRSLGAQVQGRNRSWPPSQPGRR